MLKLPTPKRYIVCQQIHGGELIDYASVTMVEIVCDNEVKEFIVEMVFVSKVVSSKDKNGWYITFDPRYAYDDNSKQQTLAYLKQCLEEEYGKDKPPMKNNKDDIK